MSSKVKTLHVRDEGLVRQKQDFLGCVTAATVFGLQFPFTIEVLLFPLLEVSCAVANFTQLGCIHHDWGFSLLSSCGFHRLFLQKHFNLASCRLYIMEGCCLCSQSCASRVSGKEAGVFNNGLILPNRIQVRSLSVPYPCGWHIKGHIEKEHFSSQTGRKQFLWNGCHFTTNGPGITHSINKIIMQSRCFSSWMIIFSFLLDIKTNQILLLILKHTTHQVFLGNSSSLYILSLMETSSSYILLVHSFVHSFIPVPKRHHLVRIMMWWVLYSFLYNLLNSKLLCVSHQPGSHGSNTILYMLIGKNEYIE